MDLLEKFAAVEIKAEGRISAADREFCEQHQGAYEAAVTGYKELIFFWEDMQAHQAELFPDENLPSFQNYLEPSGELVISRPAIEQEIISLHRRFAKTIAEYFITTYHLHFYYHSVIESLFPDKPREWDDNYEEELEKYREQVLTLTVRYQDIVERFAARMDGRSFTEQAFHELCTACHDAAWSGKSEEPLFERKKDTLRFNGNFSWYNYNCLWTITEAMKNILRGAAHYETGTYDILPLGFGDLICKDGLYTDVVEFSTCEKLCQVKIFKRGRVDLKFSSEIFAEEFICNYLGTMF